MEGDFNQNNSYNPNILPTQPIQPIQPESNNLKKIAIGVITLFALTIIIFIVILLINSSEKISEQELSQGKILEIKENNKINFDIEDEEHTLTVESIGDDFVEILIQSAPIRVNLKLGEEKVFDLDNDEVYDVLVRLDSITDGVPNIYVKRIKKDVKKEIIEMGEQILPEEEQSILEDAINDSTNASELDELADAMNDFLDVMNDSEQEYILKSNCGTSIDLSTLPMITQEWESGGGTSSIETNNCSSDEVSTCMGHNLLECSIGESVINLDGTMINVLVKEKIGPNCKIRVEYGESSEAMVSNKYTECLIPIEDIPSLLCEGECSVVDSSTCYITAGVISSSMLQLIFGSDSCEIGSSLTGEEIVIETQCDDFPTMLDSCTPFKCQFDHPLMGGIMEKEIIGIIEGKCSYREEMPNGGLYECEYPEDIRKTIAEYYQDLASDITGEIYIIEGVETDDPWTEIYDLGICTVSGY